MMLLHTPRSVLLFRAAASLLTLLIWAGIAIWGKPDVGMLLLGAFGTVIFSGWLLLREVLVVVPGTALDEGPICPTCGSSDLSRRAFRPLDPACRGCYGAAVHCTEALCASRRRGQHPASHDANLFTGRCRRGGPRRERLIALLAVLDWWQPIDYEARDWDTFLTDDCVRELQRKVQDELRGDPTPANKWQITTATTTPPKRERVVQL